jgi:hypothetical protein
MASLTIGASGTFGTPLKGCVPFVPFSAPVLVGHLGHLSRLSRLSRFGGWLATLQLSRLGNLHADGGGR